MVNEILNIRLHRWDSLTTDRNQIALNKQINSIEWMQTNSSYIIHLGIPVAAKIQETKGLFSAIGAFCAFSRQWVYRVLLGASLDYPAQTVSLCYRALSLKGQEVWDILDKQGSSSLSKLFKGCFDVLKHIPWQKWPEMEQKWVGRMFRGKKNDLRRF